MSVAKRMLEEQVTFNEMAYCDRMAEDGDPILVERANAARLAKAELEDEHAAEEAAEANSIEEYRDRLEQEEIEQAIEDDSIAAFEDHPS